MSRDEQRAPLRPSTVGLCRGFRAAPRGGGLPGGAHSGAWCVELASCRLGKKGWIVEGGNWGCPLLPPLMVLAPPAALERGCSRLVEETEALGTVSLGRKGSLPGRFVPILSSPRSPPSNGPRPSLGRQEPHPHVWLDGGTGRQGRGAEGCLRTSHGQGVRWRAVSCQSRGMGTSCAGASPPPKPSPLLPQIPTRPLPSP